MTVFRRRYRTLIDIDVRMRRIDTVSAGQHWRVLMRPGRVRFADLRVSQADYIARQQRLFDGLLRDAATLDAWLLDEVRSMVADAEFADFETPALAHEILSPLISGLPPPHRQYFEAMLAQNRFYEAVDSFRGASQAKAKSLIIHRIPMLHRRSTHLPVYERYRVSIEANAEIGEIDPAAATADLTNLRVRNGVDLGVSVSEYVEHQRALVDALLQDETCLDTWLRYLVFDEVVDYSARHCRSGIPHGEILRPVIERMSPDDQAYFRRAVADHLFRNTLETFHHALTSEIVSVAIGIAPEITTQV